MSNPTSPRPWLIAGACCLALAGCNDDDDDDRPAPAGPGTIVQEATEAGFSSLTAAVTTAGLVPTLSGTTPYTVFAPTNSAFAGVASITAGLSADALQGVLLYHTLAGSVSSTTALSVAGGAGEVTTVNGAPAFLDVVGGSLYINEAKVTATDVAASNGVIHVIDRVILPPEDIYATLTTRGFTTLKGAIDSAGLADALDDDTGTLTLFAPTNAAFAAISATVASLTTDELADVLSYHVLTSRVKASAAIAAAGGSVETLEGSDIVPALEGGALKINDATVTIFNIRCTNGVIHVIDAVLLPPPTSAD